MLVRYALQGQPVPKGWSSFHMQGWHGSMGRVIWVKMTNGRQKGAAFERECISLIRENLGFEDARRDLEQYRQKDRGDILGVPGWTIECKRYSADRGAGGNYKPEWWAQACDAALAAGCEPVLIYKYDRQPIKCVVFLSSINSDYAGKDNTAVVSFSTWCMLVRESICDEQ